MDRPVAGVVLAAGAGTRLRPLTLERPKALCPVGGVALVDLAVRRVRAVVADVAVNAHHGLAALRDHLGDGVHVSEEREEALGTAGALGRLRGWLDGRAAVVVNADAWCGAGLDRLLDGWDGERTRLLVVRAVPDAALVRPRLAGALLPWAEVSGLGEEPSGLWEVSWRHRDGAGLVEVVAADGPFVDCGTPAAYLAANLAASGGAPVVGDGARVDGVLDRAVVWDHAAVHRAERLTAAIRTTGGRTVVVR